MEFRCALFLRFPKMKVRLHKLRQSPLWFIRTLAWIWITGILVAYIHGFADIIQLLFTWFWETEK